ncbi:MAG: alpha/beta fold hydrolase [Ilumatobacter sp.]|nr:alpha/beta fold hydrolase [Ilumatobacter sp.]
MVSERGAAPATAPPPGLHGLDPTWSRLTTWTDAAGVERTSHVLDAWPGRGIADEPELTLLCVHGNPSWSYLFRSLVERGASGSVRVVAVDHLDMGFSERTGTTRRLAQRIDDLGRLTEALGLTGPVVTVAHDWGGPISLGWALAHRDQLQGVVLMNTAVHQPAGASAPTVIRIARSRPLLSLGTTATTAFIRGAFELGDTRPPAEVREGFLAPYRSADRRHAIADFVADIPLEDDHPSAATLDEIADGLGDLADVPALLLWGAADKVFSDLYLHDLEARLPHADVHRYPTAGHFVSEDRDTTTVIVDWVASRVGRSPSVARSERPAETSTLIRSFRDLGDRAAIVEMDGDGAAVDYTSFGERVDRTARALVAADVEPGDRVALMIPPGIDLAATLMACWRAGATVVLVDSGLGAKGMHHAVRAANPDVIIGIRKALAAAKMMRWPGRRLSLADVQNHARAIVASTPMIARANDLAAVVFTSGATGPSKGVRYTHGQVAAQRDAIAELYDITTDDRLVAAFAPFALYGPLLGITSVVPDMDVAAPGTLTAAALGDAVARIDASLVFASPAALVNVVATRDELTAGHRSAFERVRLVMSAGAPVRAELLRSARELFPNARLCTPYGMTECLPVANIDLDELDALPGEHTDGVCVGRPLPSVEVAIRPFDELGRPTRELTTEAGSAGEIVVRALHQRDGYDRLWHTEHLASEPAGWHATGDVGRLDGDGRLWVGGRTGHVIATAHGVLTPVGLEQSAESVDGVAFAAAVGVGPVGTHVVAIVVEPDEPLRSARLASLELHDRIRDLVDAPVAAVFEVPALPVDRRHNSKVDRGLLAEWAADVLAGGRITDP